MLSISPLYLARNNGQYGCPLVNAPSIFRVTPFIYLFVAASRERERERECVFSEDENRRKENNVL